MKVSLVSYTRPAQELLDQGVVTIEEQIAYTARVSNPANQMNNETAPKLIAYLIRKKHWSPFEMVDITLEIECTRDIGRQILRHRSFSFQEFSQRYAQATEFETSDARMQDTKNRQNSTPADDIKVIQWWEQAQHETQQRAEFMYLQALEMGIAKEVARKILPEGLTMTRMYMKGSVRSWVHYLSVRLPADVQKEHRDVARACVETITPVFPIGNYVSGD